MSLSPVRIAMLFHLIVFVPPALAQTAAITYQGRVELSGTPLSDTADFEFALWDADTGGTRIGPIVSADSVDVVDGFFSVPLDFGASVFDGDARWLEIAVRSPAGNGSFTTLSPRQQLTAVPYALQTRGLFVDDAGQVGIGTTNPTADLFVQGETIQNTAQIASTSVFGTWLTLTNQSSGGGVWSLVSTGASNAQGPGSLVVRDAARAVDRLVLSPDGHVGIGTNAPAYPLHVETALSDRAIGGEHTATTGFTSALRGRVHSTSGYGVIGEALAASGSTSGVFGRANSPSGQGVYGVSTAASGAAVGVRGEVVSPAGFAGYFVGGRNYFQGDVGLNTTDPQFSLEVFGNAGKPGGGSWAVSSDLRLKKDVKDLDGALESLLALRGVTFEYVDPEAIHELPGTRIGMIAQEVEQVFPDWVEQRNDGYRTVTYRGFEALTVEALRELRFEADRKLEALRAEKDAEIDRLEGRIAELERQVERLIQDPSEARR